MSGYSVLAQALGEIERDAFRQLAGVDEDKRGAMLENEFGDAVVDLIPHLMRGDGPERNPRHLDGEVELAPVAHVNDHRIRTSAAGEEMGHLLDRLLRG